jgi:hypothetical protein
MTFSSSISRDIGFGVMLQCAVWRMWSWDTGSNLGIARSRVEKILTLWARSRWKGWYDERP